MQSCLPLTVEVSSSGYISKYYSFDNNKFNLVYKNYEESHSYESYWSSHFIKDHKIYQIDITLLRDWRMIDIQKARYTIKTFEYDGYIYKETYEFKSEDVYPYATSKKLKLYNKIGISNDFIEIEYEDILPIKRAISENDIIYKNDGVWLELYPLNNHDSYNLIPLESLKILSFKKEKKVDNNILFWNYNIEDWYEKNDRLVFNGFKKHSVAWLDYELPGDYKISFNWKVESDKNKYYEIIFLLKGNGLLNNDFWNDNLNINYKLSPEGNFSWIRENGIFNKAKFIIDKRKLKKYDLNTFNSCEISYINNQLTFKINDDIIHDNIYIDYENSNYNFGIANWVENDNKFTITNLNIIEY